LEHRTTVTPLHTTIGRHSMAIPRLTHNQRGVALITVVLVALAVSSVAIAASMMTMSGTLVRRYSERTSMASHAALSGVERGLSALLASDTLLPTAGYTTLEDSQPVFDAMGDTIPGVWRSTYLGRSSDPSRGSIVSEVWTRGGVRAVRRMAVQAGSFASYGYFVDSDLLSSGFRLDDDIFGPVHFNDDITIQPPSGSDRATFWGKVTTTGSITPNSGNGSFRGGLNQSVSYIPLPTVDFPGLETMANNAGLSFASTSPGGNSAPMRLEFISVDMDGNAATPDEWVSADDTKLRGLEQWNRPVPHIHRRRVVSGGGHRGCGLQPIPLLPGWRHYPERQHTPIHVVIVWPCVWDLGALGRRGRARLEYRTARRPPVSPSLHQGGQRQ